MSDGNWKRNSNMNLEKLIGTLQNYYNANGMERWCGGSQMILHPSDEVWGGMLSRNPGVENEIVKLNSSSALSINYHEMLGIALGVRMDYEVAVAIPLHLDEGKGHPAMLDVKYEHDGVTYYVESKFLEPYYTVSHKASKNYWNERYYLEEKETEKWVALFKQVDGMIEQKEFCYYDINQMLKHLLAIYRIQPQANVVLKNLIWRPSETFMNAIESQRSRSFLTKRVARLTEEMETARKLIADFIGSINWKNCNVKISFYNEEMEQVSKCGFIDEFKAKYLL